MVDRTAEGLFLIIFLAIGSSFVVPTLINKIISRDPEMYTVLPLIIIVFLFFGLLLAVVEVI